MSLCSKLEAHSTRPSLLPKSTLRLCRRGRTFSLDQLTAALMQAGARKSASPPDMRIIPHVGTYLTLRLILKKSAPAKNRCA